MNACLPSCLSECYRGHTKKKQSTTPQQTTDGEAYELSSGELVGKTSQQANPSIPPSGDSKIGANKISAEMSALPESAEIPGENSGRRISVSKTTGEEKIDSTLDSLLSFSSQNTHPDAAKQTSDIRMQDSQRQRLGESPVLPTHRLS